MAIFSEFLWQFYRNGHVQDVEGILEYAEDDLCRKGFDERQIRNIVSTAMNIAGGEGKQGKLTLRHINKVVSKTEDFKNDWAYQMMPYRGKFLSSAPRQLCLQWTDHDFRGTKGKPVQHAVT
jgi:hypothetical protein